MQALHDEYFTLRTLQTQSAQQQVNKADQQNKDITMHEMHEIVVSVAKYDDIDTATLDLAYKLSGVVPHLTNKTAQVYIAKPSAFSCDTENFAETLHLSPAHMLASANFMHHVVQHCSVADELISEAVRDDFDFMAENVQYAHLASTRLLDTKQFAVRLFVDSYGTLYHYSDSMKPGHYTRLSLQLQSDQEIVVLAALSEGCHILEYLPKHHMNTHQLFMALCLYNGSAIKYASETLRCDPDLTKICVVQRKVARECQPEDEHIVVGKDDVLRYSKVIHNPQLCHDACRDKMMRGWKRLIFK
jgi:hypothetical protein